MNLDGIRVNPQRRRFRNTTTVSDAFLKEVIRFCTPPNAGPIRVSFKTRRNRSGRCFSGRCYGRYSAMMITPPMVFSTVYHTGERNGYMDWKAATWEEALVALVAHELRHSWQFRNPNGRRVWGARGCMSERDCDAYAIRKLREWRRTRPARMIAKIKGVQLARYRVLR